MKLGDALLKREDGYPKTPLEIIGFVVAHPRTWVFVVAFAVAWRCYGVEKFAARHHLTWGETAQASEESTSENHSH